MPMATTADTSSNESLPQFFVVIAPQSFGTETHAAKSNGPEQPVVVAPMDTVIPPVWVATPQPDKTSVAIVDPQTGLYWTYDLKGNLPVILSSQFVPPLWTINKLDSHRAEIIVDYGEPDGEKFYAFNKGGVVGISKDAFEWAIDWDPVPHSQTEAGAES